MTVSESTVVPGASRQFAESFAASATSVKRKKIERTDYWDLESRNASSHLHGDDPQAACAHPKRHPKGLPRRSAAKAGVPRRRHRNGWTPERRARQAALIRGWAPWQRATGPKTAAGKARSAKNALRHGGRSRAHIHEFQRIRRVLRLAAENIRKLRLFIRLRENAARPAIKYKRAHIGSQAVPCPPKPKGRRRSPWRESGSRAILAAKVKSGGETCVFWQL